MLTERHEVILHTKSGKTFRGVLWRKTGRWVILKAAALVIAEGQNADLEGDTWVDRDNVDFMQVVR
jgi:hypothetical protein